LGSPDPEERRGQGFWPSKRLAAAQLLQNPRAALGLCLGATFVLGFLDIWTDLEFDIFLFYALPVAFAAWFAGRVPAVVHALVSVAVWFVADGIWKHPYSSLFYEYWNIGLRCGWILVVALTFSRIRQDLEGERRLNAELAEALRQVKQLSGLLPICSWCKNVRNDEGYWEAVDAYLKKTTGAQFTHGVCPVCAKTQMANRDADQRGNVDVPFSLEIAPISSSHGLRHDDA